MPSIINSDNGVVSGSVGLKYTADNTGALALQTNGNTAVTITPSANVGIGITTPATTLQVTKSNVGGDVGLLVSQDTNGYTSTLSTATLYLAPTYNNTINSSKIVASHSDGTTGDHGQNMQFWTVNSGSTPTERMRITSAGYVGIGTTSPSGSLDIYTASNTDMYVRGGNAVRLFLTASSYDWKISSNYYNTGGMSFVNSGTSVFNLPQAGGFGVYTNTPTGLGSQTGASNVSTINQAGLTITQYGVTAGFYYDRLNFNNSQYFVVNSSGTGVYLGNGSTSWTAYSDSRLKNVTGTYTNALQDIAQIQSVKFTWKSDTDNKPCVGVIAQSVQSVVPEAVDVSKLPDGSGDETEYLAVRYTELIPLLIASIQELNTITKSQANTIVQLENRLAVANIA